ncbi:hypothetical protein MPH_12968 [Macrophomina phaseolina MS6]|uniref:Uncharacterized protein n=1 Tax=Macrophomina phaseolina (strain MS6) TaxID=1126212 RepID=K2RIP2_MACPH|nr:hypothetical protein MPH_12968 [Macrophomina phaseolina MS6]
MTMIEDYVNYLRLEKVKLIEQRPRRRQASTSSWDSDDDDSHELSKRIKETKLTIKRFQAILKVKPYDERAPHQRHTLFYNALQHPMIISEAVPLAKRVGLFIRQNMNSPERFKIDVIDAVNFIEAFDVYRDFAGRMANTSKLPHIAAFLPELIRGNKNNFPTTAATLGRKLDKIQLDGRLEEALDQVNAVKKQLDRLPLTVRLLLLEAGQEDGKETLRTYLRRVVLDVVWEKSRTAPKTDLTPLDILIRACLQVCVYFDLKNSHKTTYFELFFDIYSQPGMLHPKFQEKITPIRTNFSRSIRHERGENDQSKNDDSFDAIVACAVAHQGMAYSDFRAQQFVQALSSLLKNNTGLEMDFNSKPLLLYGSV